MKRNTDLFDNLDELEALNFPHGCCLTNRTQGTCVFIPGVNIDFDKNEMTVAYKIEEWGPPGTVLS